MDPDDVMSEMLLTLMKAHETFDEDSGLDIGQYWWSIWKRHRSNLVRNYYRIKRAQLVPIEDWTLDQLAGSFEDSSLPECPVDNELHRKCWHLLAIGFRASEVRKYLHLSVRKWYTVVSRWKTEEVREMLTT